MGQTKVINKNTRDRVASSDRNLVFVCQNTTSHQWIQCLQSRAVRGICPGWPTGTGQAGQMDRPIVAALLPPQNATDAGCRQVSRNIVLFDKFFTRRNSTLSTSVEIKQIYFACLPYICRSHHIFRHACALTHVKILTNKVNNNSICKHPNSSNAFLEGRTINLTTCIFFQSGVVIKILTPSDGRGRNGTDRGEKG